MSGRYARGQHGSLARWRTAWFYVHTRGQTHREAALRMGVTHATVGYYIRKGKPPGKSRELDADVIPFAARRVRP